MYDISCICSIHTICLVTRVTIPSHTWLLNFQSKLIKIIFCMKKKKRNWSCKLNNFWSEQQLNELNTEKKITNKNETLLWHKTQHKYTLYTLIAPNTYIESTPNYSILYSNNKYNVWAVDRKLWDAPTEPNLNTNRCRKYIYLCKSNHFLLTVQIYSTGCIIATI